MKSLRGTYWSYSIACAVVWTIILLTVSLTGNPKRDMIVLVGAGWGIGWLSATIARYVYPPPKSRRTTDSPET